MTPSGLVGFALWNVLVFAMSTLVLLALKRRLKRRLNEDYGRNPMSSRLLQTQTRHA
jgi:membrane protein implicated in regulation of membrane protease activity